MSVNCYRNRKINEQDNRKQAQLSYINLQKGKNLIYSNKISLHLDFRYMCKHTMSKHGQKSCREDIYLCLVKNIQLQQKFIVYLPFLLTGRRTCRALIQSGLTFDDRVKKTSRLKGSITRISAQQPLQNSLTSSWPFIK